jgi:hypothetical protein
MIVAVEMMLDNDKHILSHALLRFWLCWLFLHVHKKERIGVISLGQTTKNLAKSVLFTLTNFPDHY